MLLGLRINGSALTAENTRVNVIANNLANIDTTSTPQGGPYRRQFVVMQALAPGSGGVGQGVVVTGVYPSPNPFKTVHQPGNPLANAKGNVIYPNVNLATEMVDLIAASRAYSANANAFTATKDLNLKALTI